MILPDGLFKIPRHERMVFKIPRRMRTIFKIPRRMRMVFKIPRRVRVGAAKRLSERFDTQDDKDITQRRKTPRTGRKRI